MATLRAAATFIVLVWAALRAYASKKAICTQNSPYCWAKGTCNTVGAGARCKKGPCYSADDCCHGGLTCQGNATYCKDPYAEERCTPVGVGGCCMTGECYADKASCEGASSLTRRSNITAFCVFQCGARYPNACIEREDCPDSPQADCEDVGEASFSNLDVCLKYRASSPICIDGCSDAISFQDAYDLGVQLEGDYARRAWAAFSSGANNDTVLIGLGPKLFSVRQNLSELIQAFHHRTNASRIALLPKRAATVQQGGGGLALHTMATVSRGGAEPVSIYGRWVDADGSGRWVGETAFAPATAFKASHRKKFDCAVLWASQKQVPHTRGATIVRAAATVYGERYCNFTKLIEERSSKFAELYNGDQSETLANEMYLPSTVLFSDVDGRFHVEGSDVMDFLRGRPMGENITFVTTDLEVMPSGDVVHELGKVINAGGDSTAYYARWVDGKALSSGKATVPTTASGNTTASLRLETQLFFHNQTRKGKAKLLLI